MFRMFSTQARVLSGVKRGRCDAMTDAYSRNGKKDGGRLYHRNIPSIYNSKNHGKHMLRIEIKV